jgi:uncharacterized membrane protein
MIWIFASVALVLLVKSAGFRKFAMWTVGAAIVAAVLCVCVGNYYDHQRAFAPRSGDPVPASDLPVWHAPASDEVR